MEEAQCYVPCYQDALNTAADLALYYISHNFSDYIDLPVVDHTVAGGTVKFMAKDGTLGSIYSLRRVGDCRTDFSEEESQNPDKPTEKKVFTYMKGEFKKLRVKYNTSEISLAGCQSKGSVDVRVGRSVFEIYAESSDKHACLMDIKKFTFHDFGSIHVAIEPEEGWFCAAITQAMINLAITFFGGFTKTKVRENILKMVHDEFPTDKGSLCVSPYFDIVFL